MTSLRSNTYGYDANGNMTQRSTDGKSYTFTYDAENRLVSVSGDSTAAFVYNGDGQRVKSVMDGETTLFVGSHYEIANPGAGQTITKYYMAGASRVALRKGGTLSYMLADHLGSTSLVTDSNGDRTSELRYKPWGETRFSFGTMPTKYTFTGQFSYTDDLSTPGSEGFGLMYYGARWVDVSMGRFTQPDSLIPDDKNPQYWDRFSYVRNNPVGCSDPSGHMDCHDDCDGGGGGTTLGGSGDDASVVITGQAMTSMVMMGELRYLQILQSQFAGVLSSSVESAPYSTSISCSGSSCIAGMSEGRTIAGIPADKFTVDNVPNIGVRGVQDNIRVVNGSAPGDANAAFRQFSGGATPEVTSNGALKANLPGGGTISLYTSSNRSGNVLTLFINSPLLQPLGFDAWKIRFPF